MLLTLQKVKACVSLPHGNLEISRPCTLQTLVRENGYILAHDLVSGVRYAPWLFPLLILFQLSFNWCSRSHSTLSSCMGIYETAIWLFHSSSFTVTFSQNLGAKKGYLYSLLSSSYGGPSWVCLPVNIHKEEI